jgi:hypothetical protein
MNSGPERDNKRDQFANLSAPVEAKPNPVPDKPVARPLPDDLLEGSFSSKFDHLRVDNTQSATKSVETATRTERPVEREVKPAPEPTRRVVTRQGPTAVQRIMNSISKFLKNLLKRILALFGVGNQPTTQKIVANNEAEADPEAELLAAKQRKKREHDEGMSGPGAI